jgi:dTDP-4-dehydrorhamnose reductase
MHPVKTEKLIICVLGAGGNLGRMILGNSNLQEHEVLRIGWKQGEDTEFFIDQKGSLRSRFDRLPDVIVNTSNYYVPSPTELEKRVMKTSILGVAETLGNWIKEHRTPVITFSTYFQFCPINLRPWSLYAHFKQTARDLVISNAQEVGSNLTDFILFDNYGGLPRGKFIDLALSAATSGEPIKASGGRQLLNLTHIADITNALSNAILNSARSNSSEIRTFQLKSRETLSLREIVKKIDEVSRSRVNVLWGCIPYREREVFEMWDAEYEVPDYFQQNYCFSSYLEELFQGIC